MANRKYHNPPIQEAVCEIHLDVQSPLPKERLELLKAVWAEVYPDQKWIDEKKVEFLISPEGLKTNESRLGHRLVCKSADGTRLVQASGSFLP